MRISDILNNPNDANLIFPEGREEEERKEWAERCRRANEEMHSPEGIIKSLKGAGVPPRYLNARKKDFPSNLQEMIDHWANGHSLLVMGETGVGKTHLASAAMAEWFAREEMSVEEKQYGGLALRKPRRQSFITVPNLLMRIRGTFGSKHESAEELIDSYSKIDSLVIDDLGAEKTTDWTMEALYLLIDNRYAWERQTLVTSNLDLGSIGAKLGDRIASRVGGFGKRIVVTGKDKRFSK